MKYTRKTRTGGNRHVPSITEIYSWLKTHILITATNIYTQYRYNYIYTLKNGNKPQQCWVIGSRGDTTAHRVALDRLRQLHRTANTGRASLLYLYLRFCIWVFVFEFLYLCFCIWVFVLRARSWNYSCSSTIYVESVVRVD